MSKHFKGHFYQKVDLGRIRTTNEDQVFSARNEFGEVLLLVCDGIGGLKNGDQASLKVKKVFKKEFKNKKKKFTILGNKNWLIRVAKLANKEIYIEEDNLKSGTTLTAALLFKDRLIVINAGDSRAYYFSDRKLKQLTIDDCVISQIDKNKVQEVLEKNPEIRHGITNAVGIYPSLAVDCRVFKYNGESILLCSDGLYNNLSAKEIAGILYSNDSIITKVDMLIEEANGNGGSDNIAVVYWESSK